MMAYFYRVVRVSPVIAALVLSLSAAAHAHKVNIFAYAEGGKVHTEGYFADGTRAAGCKVTVEDMSGKQLLEGVTDGEGMFSFDIPASEDLKVVLHASMGHRNDYVITAAELNDAMPYAGKKMKPAGEAGMAVNDETNATRAETPVGGPPPTEADESAQQLTTTSEEMRVIVDETVEARLKPMYRMLAEMKERTEKQTLKDTISGIGYIMGIMAVIHFIRSRKK